MIMVMIVASQYRRLRSHGSADLCNISSYILGDAPFMM